MREKINLALEKGFKCVKKNHKLPNDERGNIWLIAVYKLWLCRFTEHTDKNQWPTQHE